MSHEGFVTQHHSLVGWRSDELRGQLGRWVSRKVVSSCILTHGQKTHCFALVCSCVESIMAGLSCFVHVNIVWTGQLVQVIVPFESWLTILFSKGISFFEQLDRNLFVGFHLSGDDSQVSDCKNHGDQKSHLSFSFNLIL